MMYDFLSFHHFIAQDVLIFFYYMGAVVMPLLFWVGRSWMVRNVVIVQKWDKTLTHLYTSLSKGGKIAAVMAAVGLFLCAELCWRMVFEAMIGYFAMHDYLYEIYKHQTGGLQ